MPVGFFNFCGQFVGNGRERVALQALLVFLLGQLLVFDRNRAFGNGENHEAAVVIRFLFLNDIENDVQIVGGFPEAE